MKLPLATILIGVLAQGCDPPAVQYPPGSGQSPSGIPNSQQTQMDKDRRWANAVESAQKAATIGGLFGGPFGGPASMGMALVGFLYGMVTADSRIAEENAQAQARYKKEADKDRVLESAIEQEIARQRGVENQIASANGQPTSPEPSVITVPVSRTAPAPQPSLAPESKPPPTVVARASNPPLQNPFRNVEVKDTNGDGIPDLWIYYNPQKPGEIVRQEEATKGDGRVDSWSYFRNGQLVRRDIDNKGQGQPDAIYYYENDRLVREERDETGQGRLTYRATYQDGRLAKVEKDTAGQGRADLWIYYDSTKEGEVVLKEERDLNGDGIPDLWSFFDNGRIVRRDVSAIGLEILSKQDQIPLPPSESRTASLPGS